MIDLAERNIGTVTENEPIERTVTYSPLRRTAAWGVHFYTALGLPLAVVAIGGVHYANIQVTWFALVIACLVDSTDGMMARAVKVKEVVPTFDGRKLDDIIDFLNFALIPCLAFAQPAFGILPEHLWWVAIFPLMASGYGFCQSAAKTDDAFVGFPSYWNIVLIYLYIWDLSTWANIALLLFFAVNVFIPIHYIYPTKTRLLRKLTMGLGGLYAVAILAMGFGPDSEWAWWVGTISFSYCVYYVLLSLVHHARVHREPDATTPVEPLPAPGAPARPAPTPK